MKGLPDNPNETFKRLNPQFYPQPVARLRASKPELNVRSGGQAQGVETRKESVRYCVVFTVYRKRLLDEGDNSNFALKAVRDLLAARMGFPNDSKKYFDFEYREVQSSVIQGTHILVRQL
jgi:hypothetical protein